MSTEYVSRAAYDKLKAVNNLLVEALEGLLGDDNTPQGCNCDACEKARAALAAAKELEK